MMSHDPHDLSGVYVLDALSEAERRRFERHLDECPSCAGEVRGLRETTSRLALAASRRPPDRLRERVLAEVGRTRQVPPRLTRRPPTVRTRHTAWLVLAGDHAAACPVLAVLGGAFAVRTHPGGGAGAGAQPGDRGGAGGAGRADEHRAGGRGRTGIGDGRGVAGTTTPIVTLPLR